jgi:AcrR family transcriptional regulator
VVKPKGKTRRRNQRQASGDTQQRILDAADVVFLRSGSAGARMQEIAEEAGVNKALLHYYFRSKDQLAEAVFRRAASELFPAVIQTMGSDLDLEQKVARVVEIYLDQLVRRPFLTGYVLAELTHHPDRVPQFFSSLSGGIAPQQILRSVLARLRSQIEENVRAGTMISISPDQFFINLLSLCVFPFAARPLLMAVLGLDERGFERMIARRRKELPVLFLRALRP